MILVNCSSCGSEIHIPEAVWKIRAKEYPGKHNSIWCCLCGKQQWWTGKSRDDIHREQLERKDAEIYRLKNARDRMRSACEREQKRMAAHKGISARRKRQLDELKEASADS